MAELTEAFGGQDVWSAATAAAQPIINAASPGMLAQGGGKRKTKNGKKVMKGGIADMMSRIQQSLGTMA